MMYYLYTLPVRPGGGIKSILPKISYLNIESPGLGIQNIVHSGSLLHGIIRSLYFLNTCTRFPYLSIFNDMVYYSMLTLKPYFICYENFILYLFSYPEELVVRKKIRVRLEEEMFNEVKSCDFCTKVEKVI